MTAELDLGTGVLGMNDDELAPTLPTDLAPPQGRPGPLRSLRRAIDAKCRDCIYDPSNGGTCREQVGACTSVSCPLWPVRTLPTYPLPQWLTARDPARLPPDFLKLSQSQALRVLRGKEAGPVDEAQP